MPTVWLHLRADLVTARCWMTTAKSTADIMHIISVCRWQLRTSRPASNCATHAFRAVVGTGLYGDTYIDLCEARRGSHTEEGGSLVGISSPGCTVQYNANLGYDMPGSGKCVMEYAMRLFALRCALGASTAMWSCRE